MFNNLDVTKDELSDSPFISFDSDGEGISRVFDDKWDFVARRESIRYIHFNTIPLEHKKNIQSYMYELIRSQSSLEIDNHYSVSKMLRTRKTLAIVSRAWNKSDYSLLSNDIEWRCLKDGLRDKFSVPTLKGISCVLNQLYKSGLLDRHIQSQDLINLSNDSKRKQSIALPTNIHANLLQQAISVIEIYHPYRFKISSVMKEVVYYYDEELSKELKKRGLFKLNEVGVKNLSRRVVEHGNEVGSSIPDFNFTIKGSWINGIIKYCIMVVIMFTGMRSSESRSTNPTSYEIVSGIPVLKASTYKGNKGVKKEKCGSLIL